MSETGQLTSLDSLGEFGLIERIQSAIPFHSEHTIRGIGDDAAVCDTKGKKLVISTDCLTEGVHFDLAYVPMKHLGHKAVAVNLSDMCAMNVLPAQILMNLSVSGKYSLEAVDELYSGILHACKQYSVELIGGDTTASQRGMHLTGTVLGYTEEEEITYRSGASVHEVICVSGNLGAAYAGLMLLERENRIYKENPGVQPDLSGYDYILQRQLRPEPRTDIVKVFRSENIKPTAMMDISDGLSTSITQMCESSGCGAYLYADRIPVHPDTEKFLNEIKVNQWIAALNGGEDYELLFTLKASDYAKIDGKFDISAIGFITDKSQNIRLELPDGTVSGLNDSGWNAFTKN
jgi:thiamine-monophosphate kinase